MAYSRWIGSEWFIYWTGTDDLCVHHVKHERQLFSFEEVKRILDSGDFSSVRGVWSDEDRRLLKDCFSAFVEDLLYESENYEDPLEYYPNERNEKEPDD